MTTTNETDISVELFRRYYDGDYQSPADLPDLDFTLLFDLIRWAAQDEAVLNRFVGTWDQGSWAWIDGTDLRRLGIEPEDDAEIEVARRNGLCGSSYCIAGQAAMQADYRLIAYSGSAEQCIKERPTDQVNDKGLTIWQDVPGAQPEQIMDVGRDVLGLTQVESEKLFDGSNDIDRLRGLANLFCQVRSLPLLFPDDPIGPWYASDEDDDY